VAPVRRQREHQGGETHPPGKGRGVGAHRQRQSTMGRRCGGGFGHRGSSGGRWRAAAGPASPQERGECEAGVQLDERWPESRVHHPGRSVVVAASILIASAVLR
jgi:hypothetical protein